MPEVTSSPPPDLAGDDCPPYDEQTAGQLADMLLAWYDRHRRDLPWRMPPGGRPDPYRVWLSEIMLQQTTVAAVRGYFEAFTSKWPDIHALATAPLDDVLQAWAGLGYYARARNLHKCAQAVVNEHGGSFPRTLEGLKALPGIGDYTAGAIAAIAFDLPHAAVDGNVERVMARMFAVELPLPDAKPTLKSLASDLVPELRPGDFAQALMDLGATICAPRKANCLICPWSTACRGRALGVAETLPRKREKPERPTRYGTAFLLRRADKAILLRRRQEKGLLGGMIEVPSTPWEQEPCREPDRYAPAAAQWRKLQGNVQHTFTHFHLVLDVWQADLTTEPSLPPDDFRWVQQHALGQEALPTVMRKIIAHFEKNELF